MKSMLFHSSFSRRRRRGSSLLMVAGGMLGLMGFAALSVDYGLLVMDANRVQRACDAAALAGAAKLKRTGNSATDRYNATAEAVLVAWQNGKVSVTAANVTFGNNDTTVRVQSTVNRKFFFGPAVKVLSGNVTRSATAQVKPISGLTTQGEFRAVPIGITWETYNAYHQDRVNAHDIQLIRQNKTTFGLDDLVLFDLRSQNSKSGAQMQNQLKGTDKETVNLLDWETTLNASNSSETKKLTDGLDAIFEESKKAPWNDSGDAGIRYNDILSGASPRNNPRVVFIIVTPSTSDSNNGTYNTQVQGFVPVYLEDYVQISSGSNGSSGNGNGKSNGNGKNKTDNGGGNNAESGWAIRMRFLPPTIASDSGLPTGSGTTLSGLSSISLID